MTATADAAADTVVVVVDALDVVVASAIEWDCKSL